MYEGNKCNISNDIGTKKYINPSGNVWSFALFLVLSLTLVDTCEVNDSYKCPPVDLKWGRIYPVYGLTINNQLVADYFGIPYALPPIGSLRFKNPQKWNLTWPSYKQNEGKMPKCIYNKFLSDHVSEDCLYLNVHRPLHFERGTQKPVLVLLHGVPYIEGDGNSKLYSPKYLLQQDIVLVTINYRLGILGFFSTGDPVLPGNIGLKDIVMALEWIQENIALFNGDPDSVILMGSSTGSEMVHLLALSKKTEGLFHKYILISGSALSPWNMRRYDWMEYTRTCLKAALWVNCLDSKLKYHLVNNPIYERLGKILTVIPENIYPRYVEDTYNATANMYAEFIFGNDDSFLESSSRTLDCMRNVDVRELMGVAKYFQTINEGSEYHFGPTIEKKSEDAVLTMHPVKILKEGLFRDIPVIMEVMENAGLSIINLLRFTVSETHHGIYLKDLITNNFNVYLPYLMEYHGMITDNRQFADAVTNFYFDRNLTANLMRNITEVVGDAAITWPMVKALKYQKELGKSDIYLFYLQYDGTFSFDANCNMSVNGLCYPNPPKMVMDSNLPDYFYKSKNDDIMVNKIMNLLINFITNGKIEIHTFKPIINCKSYYQMIGNGQLMEIKIKTNLLKGRMDFWDKLMTKELSKSSVYRIL